MDIPRTDVLMVAAVMVFAKIISQILLAWVPLDVEILGRDLVCNPKESHTYRSGRTFNRVTYKSTYE